MELQNIIEKIDDEIDTLKDRLIDIVHGFANSEKRFCIVTVTSEGTPDKRKMVVKIKKYYSSDDQLHLIAELQILINDEISLCETALVPYIEGEIDNFCDQFASSMRLFGATVEAMGGTSNIDLDENNNMSDLEEVKAAEQDQIKKFLLENNYRIFKANNIHESNITIDKLAERFESSLNNFCNIQRAWVEITVKNIGVFFISMSMDFLTRFNDTFRVTATLSSDIISEPYTFYCIDPNTDAYDDRAKEKVIQGISDYIAKNIQAIKTKYAEDRIKVSCIFYEQENDRRTIGGQYEY